MNKQKLLGLLLSCLTVTSALAAVTELDRSIVERGRNILPNPGFEASSAGWLKSAGTLAVVTSGQGIGAASGSWTPAASTASGQYVASSLVAIPVGLRGQNCEASVLYSGSAAASANGVLELQAHDGTNVISKRALPTATSYQRLTLNFICPSSGSLQIRIASTAVSGASPTAILVDDAYIGDARNIGTVAQAQLYGTVKVSGCAASWTTTSTSLADPTAQTGCTYTVTGQASAPATQLPAITFSSLPPGDYILQAEGSFANSTAAKGAYFQFSDGINVAREYAALQGGGGETVVPGISQSISYTTAQSNVTLKIRMATDPSGTAVLRGTSSLPLVIKVLRLPSASEIAYRAEALPASWSGYHGTDCLWTRANAAMGDPGVDSTCTFTQVTNRNFGLVSSVSGTLPGIVFTPTRAGRYFVCASAPFVPAANATFATRLTDGTTTFGEQSGTLQNGFRTPMQVCGTVDATSTAAQTVKLQWASQSGTQVDLNPVTQGVAAVYWNITALDQAFPAPILVGSVTSGSTGAERVERAVISCAASASITSQSGSWISSISNRSSGACVLTLPSGTFSATPTCLGNQASTNSGGFGLLTAVASSATSVTVTLGTSGGSPTTGDFNANVVCMGPR